MKTDKPRKERTIPDLVSLREAGRRLETDPRYLRGYADAMGIRFESAPPSIVMTREDFERLRERLRGTEALTASAAP